MRRYLINLYRNHEGFQNIKVFSVSDDISYDDVSLMEHSLAYFFVHSDKSQAEIESAYLDVRIKNVELMTFQINDGIYPETTVYLVGKHLVINGKHFCCNEFGSFMLNNSNGITTVVVDP